MGFKLEISMKLVYPYMEIFFNFPPTSNHLHPLQVENCGSHSRLVVDENNNGKFSPERVEAWWVEPLCIWCSASVRDTGPTSNQRNSGLGPVFSYKLRYIVGFWLVEMTISTNQKSTIYHNFYENTCPESRSRWCVSFFNRRSYKYILINLQIFCTILDNKTSIFQLERLLFIKIKLCYWAWWCFSILL